MKRFTLLFVLFALDSSAITPDVDIVTLYRTGAYVERVQKLNVESGENTILIENLPPEIDDNSVVVSADGINILDVKVKTRQTTEVFSEKLKELNNKLKELETKGKELKNNIDVINSRVDYYNNLSKSLSSNLPADFFKRKFEPKEFSDIVMFISEGLKDALTQKMLSEIHLDDLNIQIDKIKREISDLQASREKARKEIEIRVSSDKSRNTNIRISYFRSGALWEPVYRIDADPENGTVLLTMKAEVRQSGGEDWKNTVLIFSTAEPSIYGTPPVPSPWIVDFQPEFPPPRPVTKGRTMPMAVPAEVPAMAEEEMKVPAPPSVEERGVAYIFRSASRVTVPSDNMPHSFDIISKKLDAEFLYRIYPDYSPYGYLIGETMLPEDFPVIGGKLILFQRGTYVGEAGSAFTPGGDKLKLPTGIDKNLSVEKKLLRRKEFTEGVFSKEVRLNQAYQVILKNPYERKVKVEILSRIPVSRNEAIKVKIIKITPDAEIDSDNGFIKWMLEPAKNEKTELYYEFDVTYPKGKRVGGL